MLLIQACLAFSVKKCTLYKFPNSIPTTHCVCAQSSLDGRSLKMCKWIAFCSTFVVVVVYFFTLCIIVANTDEIAKEDLVTQKSAQQLNNGAAATEEDLKDDLMVIQASTSHYYKDPLPRMRPAPPRQIMRTSTNNGKFRAFSNFSKKCTLSFLMKLDYFCTFSPVF